MILIPGVRLACKWLGWTVIFVTCNNWEIPLLHFLSASLNLFCSRDEFVSTITTNGCETTQSSTLTTGQALYKYQSCMDTYELFQVRILSTLFQGKSNESSSLEAKVQKTATILVFI